MKFCRNLEEPISCLRFLNFPRQQHGQVHSSELRGLMAHVYVYQCEVQWRCRSCLVVGECRTGAKSESLLWSWVVSRDWVPRVVLIILRGNIKNIFSYRSCVFWGFYARIYFSGWLSNRDSKQHFARFGNEENIFENFPWEAWPAGAWKWTSLLDFSVHLQIETCQALRHFTIILHCNIASIQCIVPLYWAIIFHHYTLSILYVLLQIGCDHTSYVIHHISDPSLSSLSPSVNFMPCQVLMGWQSLMYWHWLFKFSSGFRYIKAFSFV